ncbi:tetratricopeptide repeat protein, partial [Corallococcus llansteffanensis]|uniref:tetratricopeptide repeat protein n=1 Tax=Corallococcus llansteffanensis TaxID=2316731 RepID=UPI0011C4255A
MPSVKSLFAWLALPALAMLVACAHSSSEEAAKSEAEEQLSTLYLRTCGGTRVEACFNRAGRHLKGDGLPKDEARAATLYELGCNGGDTRSCVGLGQLKEEGRGVAKDEAGAAKLYQQACEQNVGEGCGRLALLYGEGRGVEKRQDQAVHFFQLGCIHSDGLSCNNLGVLKLMGAFGLTQDVAGGMDLLVKACNAEVVSACLTMANEFQDGSRVRKDPELAVSYFRQACDLGSKTACERAALPGSAAVTATPEPAPSAEDGAKLAKIRGMCDAPGTGEVKGMACYLMGVAYEKGGSVKQNPGRATVFYKHACDNEVPEGCEAMRRMLGLTPEGAPRPEPKQSVLDSLRLNLPEPRPEPRPEPKQSVLESLRLDPARVKPARRVVPMATATVLDPVARLDAACRAGRANACTRLGLLRRWGM